MNEVSFAAVGLLGGLIVGTSSTILSGYTTFLATKVGNKKSSSHLTSESLLTLAYTVMLLLIASLLTASFIESLTTAYQQALLVAATVIAVIFGIRYIRYYFWHEPLVQIVHHKQFAKRHLTKSSHVLQPLMASITLLYTVSPIIVVQITLMSLLSVLSNGSALFWSMLYALGVVTPLYILTALISSKTKVSQIISWEQKIKGTTALYVGLYTILLAWILLYGVISQGAF